MRYLKQFVLGSTWLAIAPFYYSVHGLGDRKNYTYYFYTMVAPVWLGLWNVISLIIAETFGLSMRVRFLLLTAITYLLSILIVKSSNAYNYTEAEWRQYYIRLFVKHFILWNIIVYYLEVNI